MNVKRRNLLNLCLSRKIHLICVLLLSFFILFYNLGERSLWDLDEAKWTQISRQMVQTGNWLNPHIGSSLFCHKPPFNMWLISLVFYLFGESEFTARMWSAISGIGVMMLTYILCWTLYRDKITALLSSLILLSVPHLIFGHCRVAEEHCIFSCLTLLCIYFFWLSRERKKFIYFSAVCFGLIFLTYSLMSFFIPFIIFLHLIFTRRIKDYGWKTLLRCIGISLLIILPWHIFQLIHNGENFLKVYLAEATYYFNFELLLRDNVYTRFLGSKVINRMIPFVEASFRSPLFYFNAIKFGFSPWSIILAFCIIIYIFNILFRIFKKKVFRITEEDLFIIIWIFFYLSIFQIFRDKIAYRIFLLFPAFSIFTANVISKFLRTETRVSKGITFFAFAIFFILSPIPLDIQEYTMVCPLDLYVELGKAYCKFNFNHPLIWFFAIFTFILFLNYLFTNYAKARFKFSGLVSLGLISYFFLFGFVNNLELAYNSTQKSDIFLIVEEIKHFASHNTTLIIFDDGLYGMKYGLITPEHSNYGDRWGSYYYINGLNNITKKYIAHYEDLFIEDKNNDNKIFLLGQNKWEILKNNKLVEKVKILKIAGKYVLFKLAY